MNCGLRIVLTMAALGFCACSTKVHKTAAGDAAMDCAEAAHIAIDGAHIDAAVPKHFPELQEIGAFKMPPLPVTTSYCRVNATLSPAPGSVIHTEVWLPLAEAWNGKLAAVGNGGYGGSLGPPRLTMRTIIGKGYVTAADDLGHEGEGASGEDASWALNRPERIADFGHAANHATAVFAKALVAKYYGSPPRLSYFQGCSDGGREALMEAQRYPGDFNGVIAGAPANAWTRLMTSFAWDARAMSKTPQSMLPKDKLELVQAAALRQCDAIDGVTDGVIEDPRACHFNPAVLLCKGADTQSCITQPQLDALAAVYQGPRDPTSGTQIMPGYPAGGEGVPGAWELWISGPSAQHGSFAASFFRDFIFNDAQWSLASLDFHRDPGVATEKMASLLNSDNPDLSAFQRGGGRLILYHGWADAAITPYNTIEYFDDVRRKMGVEAVDQFARLYMVPGMSHCLGGPGPNGFDMLAALDGWVEHGTAPDRVVASKYKNDYAQFLNLPTGDPIRTRPLCPYPQVAHWDGHGSTDLASSFRCDIPKT
jgi:tannase/feruloyl esterase